MRDKRFVAVHRGGPLTKEKHRMLINWSVVCAEHLLTYFDEESIDDRLYDALKVAKAWERGETCVGEARRAALAAHAAAKDASSPAITAAARAVGHTVATAHMADHSIGIVYYGMKAVKALAKLGKPVEDEQKWQVEHLPPEVRELVLSALDSRASKKK